MKRHATFLAVLLVALVSAGGSTVLAAGPYEWPFIERIPVADFLLLETTLDQALTKTNDLVLYRGIERESWSALVLRKAPAGDYELTMLEAAGHGEDSDKPKRKVAAVPARIARQVETAFEIFLTHGVYQPSGQTWNIKNYGDDFWIFLRVNKTQGIAGIALSRALHTGNLNPAVQTYHQLWTRLHDLFDVRADQDATLKELDILSATFVLEEEARAKH